MTEAGIFLARNAATEETRRVAIFCYFFGCWLLRDDVLHHAVITSEGTSPSSLFAASDGEKKRKIAVLSEGQAARSSEGDVESLPKRTKGRAELEFPFGIK